MRATARAFPFTGIVVIVAFVDAGDLEVLSENALLDAGRYRIIAPVDRDSLGYAYRAIEAGSSAIVTVWEIFPRFARRIDEHVQVAARDSAQFMRILQRVRDEAHVLQHAEVASLMHCSNMFEEAGTLYVVTDEVKAPTLRSLLEHRIRFDGAEVERVLRDVGEALRRLHDAGVASAGLSLDQILSADSGLILLPFGGVYLATQDPADTCEISLDYEPLERFDLLVPPRPTSDVFSLAACCYHVLCGRPPCQCVPPPAGCRVGGPACARCRS